MRPSNKRSRNKQNRPRTLGNIVNRVFDSSGPEGKVRGTPQQIIDKYALLARDAQLSGDRVAAENFLQHAEHYTRMLNEAQVEMAREAEQRGGQPGFQTGNQNGGQQQNRRFDSREDDGGPSDGDYAPPSRPEPSRQEQPRSEQPRNDQPRQEQPRQEQPRAEQPRQEQPRPDQPREGRNDWKERRNKRFDERRARRDAGDPRGETAADSDSALVETPEQRADLHPALAPIAEPRVARVQPEQTPAAEASTLPEAAQPADAAPAKPRGRPRKPRADASPAADAAGTNVVSPDAAE